MIDLLSKLNYEGNACADYMAKMGAGSQDLLMVLDSPSLAL